MNKIHIILVSVYIEVCVLGSERVVHGNGYAPTKLHLMRFHPGLTLEENNIILTGEQIKEAKPMEVHSNISRKMLHSVPNKIIAQMKKQVGAELGQAQPGLGLGLNKFDLNNGNGRFGEGLNMSLNDIDIDIK